MPPLKKRFKAPEPPQSSAELPVHGSLQAVALWFFAPFSMKLSQSDPYVKSVRCHCRNSDIGLTALLGEFDASKDKRPLRAEADARFHSHSSRVRERRGRERPCCGVIPGEIPKNAHLARTQDHIHIQAQMGSRPTSLGSPVGG